MDALSVSLETLLQAKEKGKKEQTIELEFDDPLQKPAVIQDENVFKVQHTLSRYKVSLRGLVYDQMEQICSYVRSFGRDQLMIQVNDFPFRKEFDEKTPVHINFLGISNFMKDYYEFRDFILDEEETMKVETRMMNYYDAYIGPANKAISPVELFKKSVIGYWIDASISDRTDGFANGSLIVNSRDRKIAEEVHAEVLSALRNLYQNTVEGENSSAKALKQVCESSKHKDLLQFHTYQCPF